MGSLWESKTYLKNAGSLLTEEILIIGLDFSSSTVFSGPQMNKKVNKQIYSNIMHDWKNFVIDNWRKTFFNLSLLLIAWQHLTDYYYKRLNHRCLLFFLKPPLRCLKQAKINYATTVLEIFHLFTFKPKFLKI